MRLLEPRIRLTFGFATRTSGSKHPRHTCLLGTDRYLLRLAIAIDDRREITATFPAQTARHGTDSPARRRHFCDRAGDERDLGSGGNRAQVFRVCLKQKNRKTTRRDLPVKYAAGRRNTQPVARELAPARLRSSRECVCLNRAFVSLWVRYANQREQAPSPHMSAWYRPLFIAACDSY